MLKDLKKGDLVYYQDVSHSGDYPVEAVGAKYLQVRGFKFHKDTGRRLSGYTYPRIQTLEDYALEILRDQLREEATALLSRKILAFSREQIEVLLVAIRSVTKRQAIERKVSPDENDL